jgi:hypothetical protein
MTFINPICPKCHATFLHMRTKIRWEKYITARYFHRGGIVCRVIYMTPRDAKKALRR